MKRYPMYKDSGIDWLGEIPEHWDLLPLKRFTTINHKTLNEDTSPEYEIEYIDIGNVNERGIIDAPQKMKFKDAPSRARRVTKHNDTIISTVRTYLKAIAFIGENKNNLIASTGFAVLTPKENTFPKYLAYLISSHFFVNKISADSKGVNYPAITSVELGRLKLAVTNLIAEQKTIACFIDRKLVQIDQFISNKQRFIELLKEQKSAIVNRAVTKGLNPDAPMKPSGIEWLGDIPQEWNLRKISHLCRVVRGGSPRPAGDPKFFGGDYCPWITVGEITKDENKLLEFVSEYLTFEGCKHSRYFAQGTLVLTNSGATLGVPKILKISGCINDGSVAFLNLKEAVIYKDYLYYYFRSLTHNYRERIKQGSGQPNLNTDIIKTTPIPLGNIDEQRAIVKHIETQSAKIDLAITKAEKEIELIQEYRTTLISDAVTGKIDVRETSTIT